jgi:hypothetical protein
VSDSLVAALAAAAVLASAAPASLFTSAQPPERFQHAATFVVEVQNQQAIDARCQPLFGTPPPGMKTDACSMNGRVILPNPCAYPSESYARMLCHEMGHVNGWPPTHGN